MLADFGCTSTSRLILKLILSVKYSFVPLFSSKRDEQSVCDHSQQQIWTERRQDNLTSHHRWNHLTYNRGWWDVYVLTATRRFLSISALVRAVSRFTLCFLATSSRARAWLSFIWLSSSSYRTCILFISFSWDDFSSRRVWQAEEENMLMLVKGELSKMTNREKSTHMLDLSATFHVFAYCRPRNLSGILSICVTNVVFPIVLHFTSIFS